jgi:hypothetical protein
MNHISSNLVFADEAFLINMKFTTLAILPRGSAELTDLVFENQSIVCTLAELWLTVYTYPPLTLNTR